MAQFLRPISTTGNIGGWTGTHLDVDESIANDGDRVWSPDGADATIEFGLSTGIDPNVDTGHILRVRAAKTDDGVASATGNAKDITISLMQGPNITIDTFTQSAIGGTYTTFTRNISSAVAANITDYSTLRVKIATLGGGGNPSNRRGVGVSWVELEVPDAVVPTVLEQFAFRARNDDGSESGATWKAALNTNWTQQVGQIFRLRFGIQRSAGSEAVSAPFDIQYRLDTGSGYGSWVNVTFDEVVEPTSSVFVSGGATTSQMTGTGTFRAGLIGNSTAWQDRTTAFLAGEVAWTEFEYVLSLLNDLIPISNGNLIQIRLVNGDGTPLNTYSQTPTITVQLGAVFNRTASDTPTAVSESIARVANKNRTNTDTTSVTDSVARGAISFVRSFTDNATLVSDTISRAKIMMRTAADSVSSVTESVIRITNKIRTVTDTTSVSESVARVISRFRSAVDTTSISDSVARIVSKIRAVADTTSVTDSVDRVISAIRTIIDTTSVTDSITRIANKIRTVLDIIPTVTESVVRGAIIKIRTALDTTTLSEGVSRAAITFSRTASDSLSVISDSISRSIQLIRSTVDTIAIGIDAVSGAIVRIIFRTASDTITLGADTVARTVSIIRSLSDTTVVSDSIARVRFLVRSVVDTVVTSDAVSRLIIVTRSAIDTTTLTESVSRIGLSLVRTATDAVTNITESIARVANKIRSTSESLSVSDTVSRSWSGVRSAVDTLPAIVDTIFTSAAIIIYRTTSDSITVVTDSISRTMSMGRSAIDTVITSDAAQKVAHFVRTTTDFVGVVSDFVVRGGVVVRRTVSDSIPFVSDVVSALLGLPKYVGERIITTFHLNRFKVGQSGRENSVGGGSNRVIVKDNSNKENVR